MSVSARLANTMTRSLLSLLLCVPLLALQSLLVPANAVVPTPVITSPQPGDAVSGVPSVSWARVNSSSPVTYEVKVLDGLTEVASAGISSTVNSTWVPDVQLPAGRELTYEVRARIGNEYSAPDSVSFTRTAPSAPDLLSPEDAASFSEPGTPLVYRWAPVPGAYNYTVQVGPASNFEGVDPSQIKNTDTTNTSLAPREIPSPGTKYWRVIANFDSGKSLRSVPSTVRSYDVVSVIRSGGNGDLPTQPVHPTNDSTVTVTEVVLKWHPIDGAATYVLQYGTDPTFTTTTTVNSIKSAQYSPPNGLGNDQWYWRIAPVFSNGVSSNTLLDQAPVWTFQREWPDQPSLVHPAANETVGPPMFYEWTPVRNATRYQLQVSTNASFTPDNTVLKCNTVNTTYAPFKVQNNSECWPNASGTYYWRVLAFDDPHSPSILSELVNAQVNAFSYNPSRVNLNTPADEAVVQVPTLTWSPFLNADRYRVAITPMGGGSTITKETKATSFTPLSKLATGSYRWDVVPVFANGLSGPSLFLDSQRSFTVEAMTPASATHPDPTGPVDGSSDVRPLALTWTPVEGATSYRVLVHAHADLDPNTAIQFSDSFAYPAGADSAGQALVPGTYDWWVVAYDGNAVLSRGASRTFTINNMANVSGHKAALTGSDVVDGTNICSGLLENGCANLRQTPVLRWDPVPGAAQYRLHIARDKNNTNVVSGYPVLVKTNTMYMPLETLPDSTAGSAYYWDVVPCGPGSDPLCEPLKPLTKTFSKVSHAVQLVTSEYQDGVADGDQSPGAVQANDIVLDWDDYLCTLQALTDCTMTQTELPVGPQDSSEVKRLAAVAVKNYRVQVSTDKANMAGTQLTSAIVDQTTFTEYVKTYPEGPLYWRVQAIDGSGRDMPWSSIRKIMKKSPIPVPTEGINSQSFSGQVTLGWTPTEFAKQYDVQIFRSTDNPDTTAPLFTESDVKQTSWAPVNPLPQGNYKWRVLRVDADSRPGAWSGIGTFSTQGAAPMQLAPAAGGAVPQRGAVFTWSPPAGGVAPTKYRLSVRQGSGSWQSRVTTATSYAWELSLPITPTTSWSWKVEALAGDNTVLGTSPDRQFTSPAIHTNVVISGTGQIGQQLKIEPLAWNTSGVATTYQWYSGTSPITGATGPAYTPVTADVGKLLSVWVSGRQPAWEPVTVKSNQIGAKSGTSLVNAKAPSISGTRAYGSMLTAGPGTWTTATGTSVSPSYVYQWFRAGVPISGATARTRLVAREDIASTLTVRVIAKLPGYGDGVKMSPGAWIPKATSRTTIALAAATITAATNPRVTVTVTSPLPCTGTIEVYDGSTRIAAVALTATDAGRKVITLPKRTRGYHYLKARYTGNARVNVSWSPQVKLTVK